MLRSTIEQPVNPPDENQWETPEELEDLEDPEGEDFPDAEENDE